MAYWQYFFNPFSTLKFQRNLIGSNDATSDTFLNLMKDGYVGYAFVVFLKPESDWNKNLILLRTDRIIQRGISILWSVKRKVYLNQKRKIKLKHIEWLKINAGLLGLY